MVKRSPLRTFSNDKSPGKTDLIAAALAVSLPSMTTELDTKQKAPPYVDCKSDGLVCVSNSSAK
jgi:hypothetical protein